ncbi:MAG: hypothetical protein COV70_00350 [Parcubacteria group bacterium CG11_big_fil_rev_8_21_14_0_20_39_22]|nr:MAG: hypothetical protein COV70_00350 [Parcubacteria group bacterium CG11_big_fil_rev_8_21_14_0_20_39_22]
MLYFIEKLRSKPENDRRKFVAVVAISTTAIIAVVWFATLGLRIGDIIYEKSDKDLKEERSISEVKSAFGLLSSSIRDTIANIKEGVSGFGTIEIDNQEGN